MVANVTDEGKIVLRTATQNRALGNGRIREAYVLWPDSLANPQGLASRFAYDEASQAQWLLCASANATKIGTVFFSDRPTLLVLIRKLSAEAVVGFA